MNKLFLVALAVSACVCGLAPVSSARQQGARTSRGGLDNLSLPSTTESLRGPSLPEGWQVFEPEGAGFRVAAPAGFEEGVVLGAEARPAHRLRKFKVTSAGVEYGVGRTGAILTMMTPGEYFAAVRRMMATPGRTSGGDGRAKMELVRERAVALEGHEGREFELAGGGRRALTRFYLIDGEVFTLAVEGRASAFPAEKAQGFLDSFQLSPGR